ncbi:MAG: hypothetical protein ABIJ56_00990 [Pseudomonadota bacterium]
MSFEKRSRERRKRIVVHRAASFEDADRWDLEFWQSQTPQARLSALVAIRRNIAMIKRSRSGRK